MQLFYIVSVAALHGSEIVVIISRHQLGSHILTNNCVQGCHDFRGPHMPSMSPRVTLKNK